MQIWNQNVGYILYSCRFHLETPQEPMPCPLAQEKEKLKLEIPLSPAKARGTPQLPGCLGPRIWLRLRSSSIIWRTALAAQRWTSWCQHDWGTDWTIQIEVWPLDIAGFTKASVQYRVILRPCVIQKLFDPNGWWLSAWGLIYQDSPLSQPTLGQQSVPQNTACFFAAYHNHLTIHSDGMQIPIFQM